MRKIKLTQGQYAIVDDEDYEKLIRYKWQVGKSKSGRKYYAKRTHRENGKRKNMLMARYIMGLGTREESPEIIDHINRDTLDNRKKNLRVTNVLGNNRNTSSRVNSSSKYLGVVWARYANKWRARLIDSTTGERKEVHLGIFDDEKEAAMAYNRAAKEIFGEYANLNKI